ncbi:MAG: LacI family DNA-binding transcriptional regulator, partial [Pyramidobacter sp.]|nr:LacI family DNA-binding transcriptional regulator [Pyramidobacter sp.]
MTRVTMDDVARAAGVNKGTVSRALRGDKRISNETRERVWLIAKELGYEPDAVASGLSSRRTGVVAIVVERMSRPWTGTFLAAAAGVLSRFKLEVLLFEADSPARTRASIVRRIESRKADGLIWAGAQPLGEASFDIPVVRVGAGLDGANFRVGIDREWTAELVRSRCQKKNAVYRGGEDSAFPFLADLAGGGEKKDTFAIWDGCCASGERPA